MITKLFRHALHALLLSAVTLSAAPAMAANQIDDANFFVRQHYLDFLERTADSSGEAFWAGQITQCNGDATCVANKRIDVARAFFFSDEFINIEQSHDPYARRRLDAGARNTADYNQAFVDAAYRRYWRMPLPAWDTYVNLLNAGLPNSDYNSVIRSFINDERYRGRFTSTPYSRSLDANRNRLFADWAARNGQSGNLCQAWAAMSCTTKGSFLTLTHRLQVSLMSDYTTPLDHVNSCYAILGDELDSNHCGGDDNRLFLSMDNTLHNVMLIAHGNSNSFVTFDQNGNNYWKPSADLGGPHAPFDMSDETSYGHPRGQNQFWGSGSGYSTPVYSTGVNGIVDYNIMEIDQDYDAIHSSSTECNYGTGGCDTCASAGDRANFSSGSGRMIYARQHPTLPGSFAGPDYEWAPTGCERVWCGGCGTCEAKTSWGYLLGRPARTCADVPCDGTQDYVCTLDGGKKQCYPGYGWLSSPPPPPPICNPDDEQSCYNNGGNWDPSTCGCTIIDRCQPGNCAEYDYVNCVCLRA
jgi:hypothetical protein